MNLKVGDKFTQAWPGNDGLVFEILELNTAKDLGKIRCSNQYGQVWEEDWDDMHTVVWSLEKGDYMKIN